MSDKVLVGIASIPERAATLERTIASLAPQADRIVVALNEYPTVPEFLAAYPNVETLLMGAGNGGDAEKFAAVDNWDGYVATCDDDLLYPPDYIEMLVAGIERYGRKAAVSFHGGKTLGWNGSHAAASHKRIRCLGDLAQDDRDVNVLGTGTLGWHTDHVPVWRDVFRTPNMADVYLASHARALGIPMVALAHRKGWLQDICPVEGRRIYESNRAQDGSSRDTTARRRLEVERHDWAQDGPGRASVRVSIATCSRPQLLLDLLQDLEREARFVSLHVAVYEDPTDADYSDAQAFCKARGWSWFRMPRRCGREEHFRLVDRELADCRRAKADWFVFLPDDIRLTRHALPRAISTWQLLDDPATLTLWRLKDHEGQTNWTGRLPVKVEHGWEVFHVDGIYLCRRDTLEFLGYRCLQSADRRRRATSSGVGRIMSLKLHAAGKRMYRVDKSLATPVKGEPSVMNPDCVDRVYPGLFL